MQQTLLDQFRLRFDCVCALLELRLLLVHQPNFQNLLNAVLAELTRHAHEQPVDAVFSFQMSSAG